jgi:hypothetical protein
MNRSKIGRRYGLVPSLPNPRQMKLILRMAGLPASDTKLVAFSPMAIDQLDVGMCTGCGTSRALKNYIDYAKHKWTFTPSALDIYAKVRQFENTPLTQDSGASIGDVFTVLNEQGVCPEDSNAEWSWPFSASDNRWQEAPPPACTVDALQHKLVQFYRVAPDPDAIKTALFQGFPMVIGISVFDSFESDAVAATGVIPIPAPTEQLLGGHCLRLDAYGMLDPNHADGVNSWGQEWGDAWAAFPDKGRGRFHIPFQYLCDPTLTSDLWAIQVLN